MRESADQKNSEYGHFSRSEIQNQNFRPYLVSKSLQKVNKKNVATRCPDHATVDRHEGLFYWLIIIIIFILMDRV